MSFIDISTQIGKGFLVTLALFFSTLFVSIPFGCIFTIFSRSKVRIIQILSRGFVWIIRGTPLMLQIIVIFYLPGLLFHAPFKSRFFACFLAFVINYAAYFSEIYRGAIDNFPKEQLDAAKVLGMTKTQTFFKVILFQVVQAILPAMANEIITLVKDTALARIITIAEITKVSQDIVNLEGILWPLFYAGVFYLIFNGLLSFGFKKLETKLKKYGG
jgi:polar amino acid transport system permease protein